MLLFPNRPGQVTALLAGDGDLGTPLAVDGIAGSWFPIFGAILTGFQVQLSGNYQFSPTMRDVTYIYAFGDKIGQLRVSGLAFSTGCVTTGGLAGASGVLGGGPAAGLVGPSAGGFERALAYYQANRLAVRRVPIQVQIGVTGAGLFRGYLTDFSGGVLQADSRLGEFSLMLNVFPGG